MSSHFVFVFFFLVAQSYPWTSHLPMRYFQQVLLSQTVHCRSQLSLAHLPADSEVTLCWAAAHFLHCLTGGLSTKCALYLRRSCTSHDNTSASYTYPLWQKGAPIVTSYLLHSTFRQGRPLREQQEVAAAVIQRCYKKYKQVGNERPEIVSMSEYV